MPNWRAAASPANSRAKTQCPSPKLKFVCPIRVAAVESFFQFRPILCGRVEPTSPCQEETQLQAVRGEGPRAEATADGSSMVEAACDGTTAAKQQSQSSTTPSFPSSPSKKNSFHSKHGPSSARPPSPIPSPIRCPSGTYGRRSSAEARPAPIVQSRVVNRLWRAAIHGEAFRDG